jgi:outer membrane receptor protein involved in Fe transport
LEGKIIDNVSKEPVYGARLKVVSIDSNINLNRISDYDGNYRFDGLINGTYTLTVSMLTFQTQEYQITLNGKNELFDILLGNSQELEEVKVIGNLVTDRKTPVAVTNFSAKQISEELGSRDIPMLLNATPGVYATQSGGGDGDSRINVRGFDQRNIGVLIDGVPVNDMENGQVYWSNWFGLDAITSQLQVQRGLGATKLAMPSIGGSINIVTRGIGSKEHLMLKQEYTTGNYYRSSFTYNSSLSPRGFGIAVSASYKQADGWVQGAQSQGAFVFAKIQKKFKKHLVTLSGFMAPQSHGQRSFFQPIQYWDSAYAVRLGIPLDSSIALDRGVTFNQHWGYRTGPNGDKYIQNERRNYYNKPQITLKDFWQINNKFSLSTMAYMSIGNGGGTRANISGNVVYDSTGQVNWDAMVRGNQVFSFFGTDYPNVDKAYSPVLYKSSNILLSSVNNHIWYGFLPQFSYTYSKDLSFSGGLDFRYYKGSHYQEVTDLLGGDYFINSTDQNSRTNMKFVGDKIALNSFNNHRDALVKWGGAFGQVEYTLKRWTMFLNVSGIMNGYKGIDYFQKKELTIGDTTLLIGANDTVSYQGSNYTSKSEGIKYNQTEWKYIPGYTFKAGASYELTEYSTVFGNLGYLSRTPLFSNVINSNDNKLFDNFNNEIIQAIELGYKYSNSKFGFNVNGYYTNWKNKPIPFGVSVVNPNDPTENISVNIPGMDAIHYGGEIDLAYKLNKFHSFEGMLSIGDWTWNSSQTVTVTDFNYNFTFDAKGVHVGDAAQSALALGYRLEPIKNLFFKAQFQYFGRYFADFSPFNLKGANAGRESWIMPNYGLLNFYAGYRLTLKKLNWLFNGSIINALNYTYISDARPIQGANNAFEAGGAQVFFGQGFRFNLSLGLEF